MTRKITIDMSYYVEETGEIYYQYFTLTVPKQDLDSWVGDCRSNRPEEKKNAVEAGRMVANLVCLTGESAIDILYEPYNKRKTDRKD